MSIEYTEIDGCKLAIIKLTGTFNLDAAIGLPATLKNNIPFDYEGNIIIDISETEVTLANEEVDIIVENTAEMARYFLRKPHALLVPEASTDHSWSLFINAFERNGILFRDFKTIETAVEWLKTAEATG